ncbi:MAG TPA: thioredoxin-like domain-containing protein [Chthoniobacterales bacterium]|nr:thioredoxin-like domain-containing protein [Chthoniobacterales bacterium]
MRRLAFILLILVATAFSSAVARVLPLTAKEVALMLRAGYSSQTVQEELAARHFAGTCDAAAEKVLRDAGASEALIEVLKKGTYQSSPADAQAAQDQIALQKQKQALEAERSRKFDTLYQSQLARERAAAPSKTESSSAVTGLLKGDLVTWKTGSLVRFDDEQLGKKKLIAFYFSAQWCGPCRAFTPKLVEFYNQTAAQHPEFEIVFVSYDKSPFGMETYMRESKMPWPAIDFAKLPGKAAIKKYAGESIPCLVVVDAAGNVVADTYAGKNYLGPEKVIGDLTAMFAKSSTPGIAGIQ